MPDAVLIDKALFLKSAFTPAIVNWNRLEGRPRREDFARSLRAEIRDPLWTICRQWQFGEFRAENAGSAIDARVQLRVGRLDGYAPAGSPLRPHDDDVPLEVRVEREAIPMSLHLRVRIGRHFTRLAGAVWTGVVRSEYLARYRIVLPTDPELRAQLDSDAAARAYFAAVSGRIPDGGALLEDLAGTGHEAFVVSLPISSNDRDELRRAASILPQWLARLYSVPADEERPAWQPSRLEYAFSCSVTAGTGDRLELRAGECHGGHLDWHAFDVHGAPTLDAGSPAPQVVEHPATSFLPAPIEYSGMPHPRFWQFEDRKTSFGDIRASTSDLALLLLAEFGLVYGNDWLLVPYDLEVGSYAEVRGVVVTDVFGVRTFVGPAGSRDTDSWQRWSFFALQPVASQAVDGRLLLAPTLGAKQEGTPIDAVTFTRDEMANMVFAIEERIPGPIGSGAGGSEAALALAAHLRALAPPDVTPLADTEARVRYLAGTTVPENWIPFVPVQVSSLSGDIRLQRGRMARVISGAPTPTVAPRGGLLRHGLDLVPPAPYYVEEDEVSSSGTKVTRAFQRARWHEGRVFVWLGRHRSSGRGEAESGLRFDQVEPRLDSPLP
jgi:hypothetical protein